ncbi:MAG: hypothetical protein QOG25_639, partial [Acetobacteraceae bacterium]|nr:hypothetical protein [Acetobacteraceae bacterium]
RAIRSREDGRVCMALHVTHRRGTFKGWEDLDLDRRIMLPVRRSWPGSAKHCQDHPAADRHHAQPAQVRQRATSDRTTVGYLAPGWACPPSLRTCRQPSAGRGGSLHIGLGVVTARPRRTELLPMVLGLHAVPSLQARSCEQGCWYLASRHSERPRPPVP